MQLVAYGAQDIYLTGNPQITFFKVVYRRHTNFSMEAISQTLNGTYPGATSTGQQTAVISRNGDLVSDCWLEFPAGLNTNNANCGANLLTARIQNITVEIGGQQIDKHSGAFMETFYTLTQDPGNCQAKAINTTVDTAKMTKFQMMSGCGGVSGANLGGATTVPQFLPLTFWFNRNPGLALPLIALQYHEVKVIFDFAAFAASVTTVTSPIFWTNYIYLDTDERRRFAQVSHEYLIEQVQENPASTAGATNIELLFNHPVKELIFIGTPVVAASATTGLSTPTRLDTVAGTETLQLVLNGHDRFAAQSVYYFTRKQVCQYHSGVGGINVNDSIGVYSFALKPEEHQPSGTCNFSRIDNARLLTTGTVPAMTIYGINYNVLRIMSGMGGLAYSN